MLRKQLFIMQAIPANIGMQLFFPIPLSFVYKVKTILKTLPWVYGCVQPLWASSLKGSERNLTATSSITSLKPAEQQLDSPKQHILTVSVLQIQDVYKLCVPASQTTAWHFHQPPCASFGTSSPSD